MIFSQDGDIRRASLRKGDARSELIVQLVQGTLLLYRAQLDEAERQARQSCELARQLGARRFHAEALSLMASSLIARGEMRSAHTLALEGLELARSTGMNYCGPTLLGVYARVTENAEERKKALSEGAALLASGCVSHTYFEFYSNAIELSLHEHQWSEAERYADALAHYTRNESVPWADLTIQRGKLLAEIGAGSHSPELFDRLRELRATALAKGFGLPLPGIDAALARA